FRVQFFTAVTTGTVYVDSHLSVVRRRSVGDGFQEEVTVMNHDKVPIEFEMTIEADCDFADLFEVKDKLEKKGKFYHRVEDKRLVLGYERESFRRETWISSDKVSEIRDKTLVFRGTVQPHARWTATIEVACSLKEGVKGRVLRPKYTSSNEEAHP